MEVSAKGNSKSHSLSNLLCENREKRILMRAIIWKGDQEGKSGFGEIKTETLDIIPRKFKNQQSSISQ